LRPRIFARDFTAAGRVAAAYLDDALLTVRASRPPYAAEAIDNEEGLA
jgi:hypothetical protein